MHDEEGVVATLLLHLREGGVHVGVMVETTGQTHADVQVGPDHAGVVRAALDVDHGARRADGLDHEHTSVLREPEALEVGVGGVLADLDQGPDSSGDGVDVDVLSLADTHDAPGTVLDRDEQIVANHGSDALGVEVDHVAAVAQLVQADHLGDFGVGDTGGVNACDAVAVGQGPQGPLTTTIHLVVQTPLG